MKYKKQGEKMDIEELLRIRNEIENTYNQELEKAKKSPNSIIYEDELKDIKRELDKIDIIKDLYSNPKSSANKRFKLMKLENLYIWVMSYKTKEEYLNMSEEERFEVFHNNIPDGWTYDEAKYSIDKKIEDLEIAICKNISLIDIERKNHQRTK